MYLLSGHAKLNINSLHEDEDVLHYNQSMCSHGRQSRHLLNIHWRSLHLENQTTDILLAEEHMDGVFPLYQPGANFENVMNCSHS